MLSTALMNYCSVQLDKYGFCVHNLPVPCQGIESHLMVSEFPLLSCSADFMYYLTIFHANLIVGRRQLASTQSTTEPFNSGILRWLPVETCRIETVTIKRILHALWRWGEGNPLSQYYRDTDVELCGIYVCVYVCGIWYICVTTHIVRRKGAVSTSFSIIKTTRSWLSVYRLG